MSDARAKVMGEALIALVASSLALWQRQGDVHRGEFGTIIVESGGHVVRIARAAAGVPFRWSLTIDGRERVASSVTGLLRVLRSSLDPDFRPSRVRIAPIDIAQP